jgi:citronellol/citronellal dehydrogenase
MTDDVADRAALYDLDGKFALVTGASRGGGAATAVALAAAGCRVACAARSTDASPQRTPGTLDATVGTITAGHGEGRAVAVPTDISDADQVVAMVAAAVDAFGGLDILINNAAVTFVGDLDIPMRRHDLIMEINLRAPLIAIREAVPHMRAGGRGGRIVNVSSLAALDPIPGLMSYGISKIGLERLTVDAARQLARDGIAVNCFRIDLPVASEGFIANTPDSDHSSWEPAEVAAEGVCWMLRQPASYSGRRESMAGLRRREGIMPSRSPQPYEGTPATEMFDGLAEDTATIFR